MQNNMRGASDGADHLWRQTACSMGRKKGGARAAGGMAWSGGAPAASGERRGAGWLGRARGEEGVPPREDGVGVSRREFRAERARAEGCSGLGLGAQSGRRSRAVGGFCSLGAHPIRGRAPDVFSRRLEAASDGGPGGEKADGAPACAAFFHPAARPHRTWASPRPLPLASFLSSRSHSRA